MGVGGGLGLGLGLGIRLRFGLGIGSGGLLYQLQTGAGLVQLDFVALMVRDTVAGIGGHAGGREIQTVIFKAGAKQADAHLGTCGQAGHIIVHALIVLQMDVLLVAVLIQVIVDHGLALKLHNSIAVGQVHSTVTAITGVLIAGDGTAVNGHIGGTGNVNSRSVFRFVFGDLAILQGQGCTGTVNRAARLCLVVGKCGLFHSCFTAFTQSKCTAACGGIVVCKQAANKLSRGSIVTDHNCSTAVALVGLGAGVIGKGNAGNLNHSVCLIDVQSSAVALLVAAGQLTAGNEIAVFIVNCGTVAQVQRADGNTDQLAVFLRACTCNALADGLAVQAQMQGSAAVHSRAVIGGGDGNIIGQIVAHTGLAVAIGQRIGFVPCHILLVAVVVAFHEVEAAGAVGDILGCAGGIHIGDPLALPNTGLGAADSQHIGCLGNSLVLDTEADVTASQLINIQGLHAAVIAGAVQEQVCNGIILDGVATDGCVAANSDLCGITAQINGCAVTLCAGGSGAVACDHRVLDGDRNLVLAINGRSICRRVAGEGRADHLQLDLGLGIDSTAGLGLVVGDLRIFNRCIYIVLGVDRTAVGLTFVAIERSIFHSQNHRVLGVDGTALCCRNVTGQLAALNVDLGIADAANCTDTGGCLLGTFFRIGSGRGIVLPDLAAVHIESSGHSTTVGRAAFCMQIHSTALGGFVIIQLAAVHIEHAAGLIHLAGLQIHSTAVGIAIHVLVAADPATVQVELAGVLVGGTTGHPNTVTVGLAVTTADGTAHIGFTLIGLGTIINGQAFACTHFCDALAGAGLGNIMTVQAQVRIARRRCPLGCQVYVLGQIILTSRSRQGRIIGPLSPTVMVGVIAPFTGARSRNAFGRYAEGHLRHQGHQQSNHKHHREKSLYHMVSS